MGMFLDRQAMVFDILPRSRSGRGVVNGRDRTVLAIGLEAGWVRRRVNMPKVAFERRFGSAYLSLHLVRVGPFHVAISLAHGVGSAETSRFARLLSSDIGPQRQRISSPTDSARLLSSESSLATLVVNLSATRIAPLICYEQFVL